MRATAVRVRVVRWAILVLAPAVVAAQAGPAPGATRDTATPSDDRAAALANGDASRPPGVPSTSPPEIAPEHDVVHRFVDRYCFECHNSDDKTAGLALDT